MSFLFGRSKTPQEMMKEHQRLLRRSMREMDRERASLQQQEKKIIIEIKKMAKSGQMGAAKIMARDLVRTKAQIQKMYQMKSSLQTVSMRIQTLRSTAAMASAMHGVTKAMVRMNQSMNLPAMQRVMMEFQRQTEIMDMKEEMMEDTMEDMFDFDGDEEEESEEIINQVLDEIGINLATEMNAPPVGMAATETAAPQRTAQLAAPAAVGGGPAPASTTADAGLPDLGGPGAAGGVSDVDSELQARLNRLRGE